LIKLSFRKIAVIYISELKRDSEENLVDIDFKKHESISLSDFSEKPVNTEKLTKEVTKLLKIRQKSQKEGPNFEIPLKGFNRK